MLDVDLGTTAARSAETSAQPARQPALDGAGPLDVHQHALTIDFLTVGVLVRGYCLPRVVRLCIFVWDRKRDFFGAKGRGLGVSSGKVKRLK